MHFVVKTLNLAQVNIIPKQVNLAIVPSQISDVGAVTAILHMHTHAHTHTHTHTHTHAHAHTHTHTHTHKHKHMHMHIHMHTLKCQHYLSCDGCCANVCFYEFLELRITGRALQNLTAIQMMRILRIGQHAARAVRTAVEKVLLTSSVLTVRK